MFQKNSTSAKDLRIARRKRHKERFLFLIVFVIIGMVLVIVTLRREELLVDSVQIIGAKTIFPNDIKMVIEHAIVGETFFIPQRNFFLVPKKKIKETLQETFPRIEETKLQIKNRSVLIATIIEHAPEYLWCTTSMDTCFFVDRTGILFAEAPIFTDRVLLIFSGDIGTNITQGVRILPEALFAKVTALQKDFVRSGIIVSRITIEQNHFIFEVQQLAGVTVPDAEIYIPRQFDQHSIVNNLLNFLEYASFSEKLKRIPEELRYIDLRFGDKVFYKFSKV